ncbi:MAG: hypothetical protein FWF79_01985 [Defluviitaleaceae bacterium]|nr:hypothetical protein [Defluviitaleaceae bacterium]
MVGFTATSYIPLTAAEKALAKEHRAWKRANELFRARATSECEEERAAATAAWHEERETNAWINGTSGGLWQQAIGINVFTQEDFDNWVLYSRQGIGRNPFNIPQVPAFNLSNLAFSFNVETNTINIGVGSKIQMDGYFLEILENSVVARSSDGSVLQQGTASATALNSLLRGIGVNATWGYDAHTKQITMNFLNKLGVDTSRPFFINGTQFEIQDNKLRTVGQTAQQDLQFWGFEGLNRLTAREINLRTVSQIEN